MVWTLVRRWKQDVWKIAVGGRGCCVASIRGLVYHQRWLYACNVYVAWESMHELATESVSFLDPSVECLLYHLLGGGWWRSSRIFSSGGKEGRFCNQKERNRRVGPWSWAINMSIPIFVVGCGIWCAIHHQLEDLEPLLRDNGNLPIRSILLLDVNMVVNKNKQ